MVMFNLMAKKKVNGAVPLTLTVMLIQLQMTKK